MHVGLCLGVEKPLHTTLGNVYKKLGSTQP